MARLVRFIAAAASALAFIAPALDVAAQDLEISTLKLEPLATDPPGVRLVAATRSAQPIPAERVEFKAKGNVLRITFDGIPLTNELGIKHDIDTAVSARVDKAYAVAETNRQCFVRLRFTEDVELAMKGVRTTPTADGVAIDFPFGAALPEPAPAEPDPNAFDFADAPGSAPAEPSSEPSAEGDPKPGEVRVAEGDEAGEPKEGEGEAEPALIASAAPPASAAPAPVVTAPAAAPSSLSRINLDDPLTALALMLLVVLSAIALLATLAWLRARRQPPAPPVPAVVEGSLSPTDVQLLARYSLGDQSELLVVRVLGDVFVIGNGPLTLLRRLSAEPQGNVWGAVDDIQRKLRELLLQAQASWQPNAMPDDEVGAIVEKIDPASPEGTIDFQEALKRRRQQLQDESDQDAEKG